MRGDGALPMSAFLILMMVMMVFSVLLELLLLGLQFPGCGSGA